MAGTLLIDSIVRQTTVLIATLATEGGGRPSLAHVANQVLLNLTDELKARGVGTKVIADMFGLALRTYHDRVARLTESRSESGRSLWDAVLAFLEQNPGCLRAQVLQRFARDDQAIVRGVLSDLVRSGLVFRSGQGDATQYRVATAEERGRFGGEHPGARAGMLVVAVHQHGPITRDALQRLVPIADAALDAALEQLVADGSLLREPSADGPLYRAERVFIAYDDPAGWEAAVFDHYQALVLAICAKLRSGRLRAELSDAIGGSTYHLDVWDGHPHQAEALGLLANLRRQAVALRTAVEAYNATHERPAEAREQRVLAYVGQTVTLEENGEDDDQA